MSGRRYTIDDWRAATGAIGSGASCREAGRLAGVPRTTAWRWSRSGLPPGWMVMDMALAAVRGCDAPRRPSPRSRLALEHRCLIAAMRAAGATHAQIAERIGFSRPTVTRELARCPEGRYDPLAADAAARRAARRPKARRLDSNPALRAFVAGGLIERWSPRQVSRRLEAEYPDDPEMRLSHEAIYQALYVQGRGSLRQELRVEQALRSGRAARKPRSRLPGRRGRRTWVEGCEISLRPAEAADRAVPGHWEGDLVVGGDGSSCLVTLVERSTRFLVARRMDSHAGGSVVDLLVELCAGVPEALRAGLLKTLTWDQGSEMAGHARFTLATGFRVYFCDPHSPWQRGSNENTNGLIRQYFPKGTRFTDVTDEEVRAMQDQLNGRPRETLGWRTPAERLQELLAGATEVQ